MIEIHSNRNLSKNQIFVGFVGENKAEKIEFVIPEYLEKYSKKIIFQPENGEPYCKLFDNITSNIYTLTREETQYEELDCCIQFFNVENEDEIIYKTSMLHIIFDKSLSCNDDVSENDPKVVVLDELIVNVNYLLEQVDTIDIDIVNSIITITKKDGTTKSVNVKGDKGDKGDAGSIKFIIVNELPTEDIDESAMYLVPNTDPDDQNSYDEYVYTDKGWELLGNAKVEVDLTDYVKNTDYATSSKAGVGKVASANGININSVNGNYYVACASETEIDAKTSPYKPIVPKTLNYAVGSVKASENQFGTIRAWMSTNEDGEQGLNISTEV